MAGIALAYTLCLCTDAHAELTNKGLLDNVLLKYKTLGQKWVNPILTHAKRIFWFLALTSMVWNFGQKFLQEGASFTTAVAEFIRFSFITGLYWTGLIYSPRIAPAIMSSMRMIGAQASSIGTSLSPSVVADTAFRIFDFIMGSIPDFSVGDAIGATLLALAVLASQALIAINMVLVMCSSWILCYAGIIVLAFGGATWSNNIALGYYKAVLAIGVELMVMGLMVGVGQGLILEYFADMSDTFQILEAAIIVVGSCTLLVLINKVPPQVAGLIPGATGSSGTVSAGALFGAATFAAAAVATGGAAAIKTAAEAAGAAKAVSGALGAAANSVDSGDDIMSQSLMGELLGGSADAGGGGAAGGEEAAAGPLSQAAGSSAGENSAGGGEATAGPLSQTGGSSAGDGDSQSGLENPSDSTSAEKQPGSADAEQSSSARDERPEGEQGTKTNKSQGDDSNTGESGQADSGTQETGSDNTSSNEASSGSGAKRKMPAANRGARIAAEASWQLSKGLYASVISPRVQRSLGGRIHQAIKDANEASNIGGNQGNDTKEASNEENNKKKSSNE